MNTYEQCSAKSSIEIPLSLEVKDIKMPIYFEIKLDGYVGIGNTETQVGIGGKLFQDKVKLSHIYVPENLRGKGIGEFLVKQIEKQLAAQGINKIFAVFGKISTIKFFMHQGYNIVSSTTLNKEEQKQLGIDEGVLEVSTVDEKTLDLLKQECKFSPKKILLLKEIGKK